MRCYNVTPSLPPRTFLGRFFYNNFRAVEENEEPFILQVYTGRECVTPLPCPLPPPPDGVWGVFYNSFRAVKGNEQPFSLWVYTNQERVSPLPLPPSIQCVGRFFATILRQGRGMYSHSFSRCTRAESASAVFAPCDVTSLHALILTLDR